MAAYQEYPRMLYHGAQGQKIVHDAEQHAAANQAGWVNHPHELAPNLVKSGELGEVAGVVIDKDIKVGQSLPTPRPTRPTRPAHKRKAAPTPAANEPGSAE